MISLLIVNENPLSKAVSGLWLAHLLSPKKKVGGPNLPAYVTPEVAYSAVYSYKDEKESAANISQY